MEKGGEGKEGRAWEGRHCAATATLLSALVAYISGEFIPWTRCSIRKGAIGYLQSGAGRSTSHCDHIHV